LRKCPIFLTSITLLDLAVKLISIVICLTQAAWPITQHTHTHTHTHTLKRKRTKLTVYSVRCNSDVDFNERQWHSPYPASGNIAPESDKAITYVILLPSEATYEWGWDKRRGHLGMEADIGLCTKFGHIYDEEF